MPSEQNPSPTAQAQQERKQDESNFLHLATGVQTLDELFLPDKDEKRGIVYAGDSGFFGVIIGAAGTGKSVLALQMCCRFVTSKELRTPCKAIYVSQESLQCIRDRAFREFGFLDSSDWISDDERRLLDDEWNGLTVVHMPLDPERQRNKINYLLECLSQGSKGTFRDDLLLCLDNAETIQPEAFRDILKTIPEEPDGLYYKNLRKQCSQYCLKTWWVFEEGREPGGGDTSTASIASTPQAYAADIVIRLSARESLPRKYRERDLEVIKARHQSYRRGRHAISIYNKNDLDHETGRGVPAPGIVVWPSIATQLNIARTELLKKTREKRLYDATTCCQLGINEVDLAIARANRASDTFGYLQPHSVGVLVSDLDALATEIALHFALQGSGEETVFFCTSANEQVLRTMIENFPAFQDKNPGGMVVKSLTSNYISEGKLLKNIADAIKPSTKRIVFDNLSALASRFPLINDERAFVAALFGLLQSKNAVSLLIDVIEVGEGRNPLSRSFAAGLAAYVFLLRHVEFQAQVRKVFHVLKLAGLHEPQEIWELRKGSERIEALDRLGFYKGVLGGRPEQITVMLSLYADAEDSPVDRYLRTEGGVMQQTFGQTVKINHCHPIEYAALQNSLSSGDLRPLGDCHVISIDEIWLKQLIQDELLEPFERRFLGDDGRNPDAAWSYPRWVTTGYDIAIRALRQKHADNPPPANEFIEKMFLAVPDRNNVGILAYNPNVWQYPARSAGGATDRVASLVGMTKWASDTLKKRARTVADKMKSRFASDDFHLGEIPWESEEIRLHWEDLVELQSHYVRHVGEAFDLGGMWLPPSMSRQWEEGHRQRNRHKADQRETQHTWESELADDPVRLPAWGVFTFSMNQRESCVCFLLELLLSRLGKEACVINERDELDWTLASKGSSEGTAWVDALALLLQLLSPWDIQRLSQGGYRSTNDERPCLFSRQWFSSWGALGLRQPGLWIKELPLGADKKSSTVSGVWYLGILHGSTAVRAGVKLIRHLTSENAERFKVNRGIGLPVRVQLYGAKQNATNQAVRKSTAAQPMEVRPNLPYRREFIAINQVLREKQDRIGECPREIRTSRTPFYRSLIRHYSEVSPLLMGMMVNASRLALEPGFKNWMWQRCVNPPHTKSAEDKASGKEWQILRKRLKSVVTQAKQRYRVLCRNADHREPTPK